MARRMLKAKGMFSWLWGEAVAMVVFTLNRSPMRSIERKTLFKA